MGGHHSARPPPPRCGERELDHQVAILEKNMEEIKEVTDRLGAEKWAGRALKNDRAG
jgi:hypothetical protein